MTWMSGRASMARFALQLEVSQIGRSLVSQRRQCASQFQTVQTRKMSEAACEAMHYVFIYDHALRIRI